MIIGGTASVLGGGKFTNGAQTAAFGYLFNFLAHVWMPDLSRGQVGHVMITTDNGRVIESQFPSNHAPLGPNTTLTAAETVASEGRPADHVYYIPNDSIDLVKATAVGQSEASKPTWALLAVNGQTMTNCSVAATNVLSAVNQWVDRMTEWQVPTPWNFNSLLNVLSDWQKSGTANTNVYKIK